MNWPITQIRIARPVSNLEITLHFYRNLLGLSLIGRFSDHDGISGIMLGMPGAAVHLEFTQHHEPVTIAPPSGEHLLVLYFENNAAYTAKVEQLTAAGCISVQPENPYWKNISTTFTDPDGWRVVLVNRPGFSID